MEFLKDWFSQTKWETLQSEGPRNDREGLSNLCSSHIVVRHFKGKILRNASITKMLATILIVGGSREDIA